MNLITELYRVQVVGWPKDGRHILAQFDEQSVVVYQAYCPAIGHFAAEYNHFGGEFSFSRMSWIKPNFLWMMYRSSWGTKEGQEIILAVRLKRFAFNWILKQAVHSSFITGLYPNEAEWKQATARSSVLLQWDPDHDPSGKKVERRALQLGLRGEALKNYAQNWIIDIEDISEFVKEQRQNVESTSAYSCLVTPQEKIYPIEDSQLALKLGMS